MKAHELVSVSLGQTNLFDDLFCPSNHFGLAIQCLKEVVTQSGMGSHSCGNILKNCQVLEDIRNLERSAHPEMIQYIG
jgi:hypothetical protein